MPFVRLLAVPALAACLLSGQDAPQQGGAGAGAGGGATTGGAPGGAPGGGASIPGGNPNPGRNIPGQQQDDPFGRNRFPEMAPRPIFLSGKVMMEDGGPPPEPVTIERICNGNSPRPEGYTDSKGQFSFELGRNQGVFSDASTGGNDDFGSGGFPGAASGRGQQMPGGMQMPGGGRQITERDLMGCEIRATLPGFRSDVVALAGRRSLDNPNVGTIILRRLANVEGLTTSATSLMAPKDARKSYDKGRDLMRKKKPEEARKEYEKALSLYPKYAAAWYELGLTHELAQRDKEAQEAYTKSVEADPKFIKPYLNIAAGFARDQKWKEAAEASDKAIKLNPYDFPGVYFYSSLAHYNLKDLEAAEKSAREGMKADKETRIPKLAHILGVVLAQKQDFAGAAENMKLYLKHVMPGSKDAEFVQKQIEQVEGLLKADKGPAQQQQ